MLSIEPSGRILGATLHGANLADPLNESDIGTVLFALGEYGVVRFPGQNLTPARHIAFARQFGTTQKVTVAHIPEHPDMSVLSNIVENGKPLGIADAGVVWHRDMTYQQPPGFANILHAIIVPKRKGTAIGDTQFVDSQAAYDDLPDDLKARLRGKGGIHKGSFYQERIREQYAAAVGGTQDNRYKRPDTIHPIVLTHPISGRPVLYCDSSHVSRIDGLSESESDEILHFLNAHQIQPKYLYSYSWTEGDVVMWDNFRSLHRGSFDYTDDEPRLIRRCQILSDKILDPAFMTSALAKAGRPYSAAPPQ